MHPNIYLLVDLFKFSCLFLHFTRKEWVHPYPNIWHMPDLTPLPKSTHLTIINPTTLNPPFLLHVSSPPYLLPLPQSSPLLSLSWTSTITSSWDSQSPAGPTPIHWPTPVRVIFKASNCTCHSPAFKPVSLPQPTSSLNRAVDDGGSMNMSSASFSGTLSLQLCTTKIVNSHQLLCLPSPVTP